MLSDEQLARAIQRGDKAALTPLVERHHSPLIGYLYRMTGGDRQLAEDLAQEAFLRALRGIAGYRYPRPFKPWLYAIATNLARDHYKRADTRRTEPINTGTLRHPAPNPPEAAYQNTAEAQQVAAAVAALPAHQREAVILRYYQNFSLAEIAAALNIPTGTVKSRLSLGLKRLRELMK